MIRLTLNAHSNHEIHLFNKTTILIGSASDSVDLFLPELNIQPVHLKIVEKNGAFLLINFVNDPFVSLNGQPFGKKGLKAGDIITVLQTTILFENLISLINQDLEINEGDPPIKLPENENKAEKKEEHQSEQMESELSNPAHPVFFSLPFEKEVSLLGEDELQRNSIENYLKNFEAGTAASKTSSPPTIKQQPVKEKKQPDRKKRASLKDDYLRDLEDDNHVKKQGPFSNLQEPSHLYQAWKWILFFIFSLLIISGAIGSIIYFTLSDKTEAHETKAAQGVADIAMALTHAQIYQLKPQNENWSDVDFLKSNLQTILPELPSYASHIDAQGQFNCCPYSLRIYTNRDLSHFLLIAQPAPSLLNWIISPSLIVVDSHLMELRILKDVRSLNRLLTNSDPLEGISGKEVTSLIKQAGLIHLATLAGESGQNDFAPPKSLSRNRPGAENFIYNAPRYYLLGHAILQKAIAIGTSKGSSQEVAALKQHVENLSKLNHFTLYTPQGKTTALLARQSFTLFAPSEKLLFGYFDLNAQGQINRAHLLKTEDEIKEHSLPSPKDSDQVAYVSPSELSNYKHTASRGHHVDANHPIYIRLQSLAQARENELKPLSVALNAMVNHELTLPNSHFQVEFQELSHAYLMANAKHKQLIKEMLDSLFQQYEDLPVDQFLSFIQALKLEHLIQQEDHSLATIDENCRQNLKVMLTYINHCKSFAELDNLIHIASAWLNFEYIKDPDELLKYQNRLRNIVISQLERHLLYEKRDSIIKREDRELLLHILDQERIIRSDEKEYFLGEFDNLQPS